MVRLRPEPHNPICATGWYAYGWSGPGVPEGVGGFLTMCRLCPQPLARERKVGSYRQEPITQAEAAERLVIDAVNAAGAAILQTIWAATAGRRAGHRLARTETGADPTRLMHRVPPLRPTG